MIRQMFKLIWNRKRSNFLMITGLFISFFVLFMALVAIGYNVNNYMKPLGFNYQNVWKIQMDWKSMKPEEVKEKLTQMEFVLQSFPHVQHFAYSQSLLFMPGSSTTEDLQYEGKTVLCQSAGGGDAYPEVLDFKMTEGRWFNEADKAATRAPVVINKYAKQEFFPDGLAIGKILTEKDRKENITEYVVVGVVDEFRFTGEYSGSENVVFHRLALDDELDSDFLEASVFFFRILARVSPGATVQDEERLLRQLSAVGKGITINIDRLEESARLANKTTLLLPILLMIICGFLVFNVALGLFGMIWYHTNQRTSEIGLRRATGATSGKIYAQILGESLVLTTFGILIGSFFALQFPLLNLISFIETNVYYFAFVISIVVLYFITAVCAIYPSRLASKIQPAAALHYE